MENIRIPVSPGELLDKITILEIKAKQIPDGEKLRNVKTELDLLEQIWKQSSIDNDKMRELKQSLKTTNIALWEIEDKIRIKEARKEFDQEFVELARSVYLQNDKRAATKKEINVLLGSGIMEEKSYAEY
ncbi:MAG: DUF6165 family protein [Gammaproteobacteria bacterium]|nr:DUF6165 family protein [Gammaproteobacteria bacterium]